MITGSLTFTMALAVWWANDIAILPRFSLDPRLEPCEECRACSFIDCQRIAQQLPPIDLPSLPSGLHPLRHITRAAQRDATRPETRRPPAQPCAQSSTVITLLVGVVSKCSVAGHTGQWTSSAADSFGSPCRAKAPRLRIIALASASRPGRFAVELTTFENSEGPKVPKMNGRSNACAAP